MSLTDDIYRELSDGLEKGLDWQQFLAKHSASKGPLYNAIGRFFNDIGPKIAAPYGEKTRVQNELNQAELRLKSLDQRKKEIENDITSLESKRNVLNGRVETVEVELTKKSELVEHLAEIERLGFDSERLKQMQEKVREIGLKHGVKGKDAVSRFFDIIKDYELVLGAELQLKGLQTQIETRKIEIENWQAKEEVLKRKHDDLKEAIEAVHALRTRGIKVSQIITWHKVLSQFQEVEQLDESLRQYGGMTGLLNAREEEIQNCELLLAKAQGQVDTLEKDKAKIEGAIDVLKVAGVKELRTMSKEAAEQLRTAADNMIKEIRSVGQEVRAELIDYLNRLDNSNRKVFDIGQEFERVRQELQKYEGVKAALESHAAALEGENEVPKQS